MDRLSQLRRHPRRRVSSNADTGEVASQIKTEGCELYKGVGVACRLLGVENHFGMTILTIRKQ